MGAWQDVGRGVSCDCPAGGRVTDNGKLWDWYALKEGRERLIQLPCVTMMRFVACEQ